MIEVTSPTSFVVRVQTVISEIPVQLTGILVSPSHVVTCAHVALLPGMARLPLKPEQIKTLGKVPVQIRFADGSQATGTTIDYATPDCALIQLDQLASHQPARLLANLEEKHEKSLMRYRPVILGYSEQDSTELMEASVRKIILPTGPHVAPGLFDFQIEGGLLPGTSGSPMLVQVDGEWFVVGMAYLGGHGSATSRLVSSQVVLQFLGHHFVDCLPAAEANEHFRAEQSEAAAGAEEERCRFLEYVTFAGRFSTSDDAISLPEVYVHRTEQEETVRRLLSVDRGSSRGSWLSIQGHAGSGKSSLLWCLHHDLFEIEGAIVQPFAAQFLSDDFKREESIIAYQAAASAGKKCVVLIDTLDLIVGRGDRELVSFISSLQARGVSLVTTCRPLEAQRLSSLHAPAHIIPLRRYSEPESIVAVRKYVARAYQELTPEQQAAQEVELWNLLDGKRRVQELSFEPLILRMIFEVYPPDPIPSDINTALVYSAYWERCVIRDRLRNFGPAEERERESFACRLADMILFSRVTSFSDSVRLSEFEVAWRTAGDQNPFPFGTLDSLKSSGVLEEASNGAIRFFHQTLLEFAAARYLVRAPTAAQMERIDRILFDLQTGVFLRAPVLVQIAVQDAQAGGDLWVDLLNRLLEVGTDSACYLSLEILGKIPDKALTAKVIADSGIMERWSALHLDLLAACAVDTVGQYPKSRIPFGLTILERVIQTEETNEIFSLVTRLASIAPRAVLDCLKRTMQFVRDRRAMDGDARGHYRSALLACADAGEPDAIRVLGQMFPHLHEGQQQGTLISLSSRVTSASVGAIADFQLAIKDMLYGGKANQIIADYLMLLIRVHDAFPDVAVRIAKAVLGSGQPERVDDIARLRGAINGKILKSADTIPLALEKVTSSDHLERMTAAAILSFADGEEQERIIEHFLSLDLTALSPAVRGSLFNVVADLRHVAPGQVMRFISSCPWPESAAGKAWRSIAAQLAALDNGDFKEWLLQQIGVDGLTRMVAVGLSQFLLVQSDSMAEQEVRKIFGAALTSDVRSLSAFAQATGAIATAHRELGTEIVHELIKPRHCDVWAALAYSMREAIEEGTPWIFDTVPQIIAAAMRRGDHGVISKLLEGLRAWPEVRGSELAQLLEDNFTEEVLSHFPQEKCQVEYLLLVRTVSKAAPDRAFRLLGRAIIQTPGTEGTATNAAANIARHTTDEVLLKILLDRLLGAAPNGVQRTTRFAIQIGLSAVDEGIGHRYVVESFFKMYRTIGKPEALKRLITSVNDLPSWTLMDTERLLADVEHITGSVRSHVLKLKKKLTY